MSAQNSRVRAEFEVTKQTTISVDGREIVIRVVRRESRNRERSFRLVSPFWKIAWLLRYVLVRPARWLAGSNRQWVVLRCPGGCENRNCVELGHARQLDAAYRLAIDEVERLTTSGGST